jgi:ATP-dependent Lon protease
MAKKNTPAPEEETVKLPDVLPVLPLKDAVIFPYVIVPLSVGRDKSVQAVDQALAGDRLILLLSQHDPATEEPKPEDLHTLGTAGLIMRMLKLPDGRIRILVQGVARVRVEHMSQTEPFLQARIQRLDDAAEESAAGLEGEALLRSVKEGLERAQQLGKNISAEVMTVATNLDDAGRLADLAASNIELKVDEAQQVLETLAPQERLKKVSDLLQREIQLLTMQQEISSQARGEMDKSQREYFLRQQLKAIQQELGEGDELSEEVAAYRRLLDEKKLPEEARVEVDKQL